MKKTEERSKTATYENDQTKVQKIDARIGDLEVKEDPLSVNSALVEIQEKEQRKCYLISFNVDECNSEDAEIQETHDI